MAPPPRKRQKRLADEFTVNEQEDHSASSSDQEEQAERSASESEDAEDPELAQADTDDAPKGFLHASRGEAYLHAVARPSKTSSNKLSDAFDEPFTKATYQAALAAFDEQEPHKTHLHSLQQLYVPRFPLWEAELLQGFSLLFHGVGSKRLLLQEFAQQSLCKLGHVVVANAFASGVAITDVLGEMERVLEYTRDTTTAAATVEAGVAADKNLIRARALCRHLEQSAQHPPKRVFVLIHSIDAPTFRSTKIKAVLAVLAACPLIHLVASVDHVKAMLLFPAALVGSYPVSLTNTSTSQDRGFAFMHHHTPTFQPYTQETLLSGTTSALFPPAVFPSLATSGHNSSSAKIASTLAVLASLQNNARELFKHFAQVQLSRIPPSSSASLADKTVLSAVTYDELLESCKRNFWANNESQMESLLLEFRDHDIVKGGPDHPSAGAAAGTQDVDAGSNGWLWIDMGKMALESVIERIE